jgi:hypothetical protein
VPYKTTKERYLSRLGIFLFVGGLVSGSTGGGSIVSLAAGVMIGVGAMLLLYNGLE